MSNRPARTRSRRSSHTQMSLMHRGPFLRRSELSCTGQAPPTEFGTRATFPKSQTRAHDLLIRDRSKTGPHARGPMEGSVRRYGALRDDGRDSVCAVFFALFVRAARAIRSEPKTTLVCCIVPHAPVEASAIAVCALTPLKKGNKTWTGIVLVVETSYGRTCS